MLRILAWIVASAAYIAILLICANYVKADGYEPGFRATLQFHKVETEKRVIHHRTRVKHQKSAHELRPAREARSARYMDAAVSAFRSYHKIASEAVDIQDKIISTGLKLRDMRALSDSARQWFALQAAYTPLCGPAADWKSCPLPASEIRKVSYAR